MHPWETRSVSGADFVQKLEQKTKLHFPRSHSWFQKFGANSGGAEARSAEAMWAPVRHVGVGLGLAEVPRMSGR